jgi:formylglycine-generating enzyme required for sulfatase activity
VIRRLLGVALVCAGCSGTGVGHADGALGGATGAIAGPWQIIDLDTGAVTAVATAPDVAGDARYRDRYLVCARIPAGRTALGQSPASPAAQEDETPAMVAVPGGFLAVTELTRAQWWRLAGTRPWEAIAPAALAGGADDRLPALGATSTQVAAALAAWSTAHGVHLALPDGATWERAARAGAATVYPWGDDADPVQAAGVAAVWETAAGAPEPVALRGANAFGLYDILGNAWELTADGAIRGGSWADPLTLARPANRAAIAPDTACAVVGVRACYRP